MSIRIRRVRAGGGIGEYEWRTVNNEDYENFNDFEKARVIEVTLQEWLEYCDAALTVHCFERDGIECLHLQWGAYRKTQIAEKELTIDT